MGRIRITDEMNWKQYLLYFLATNRKKALGFFFKSRNRNPLDAKECIRLQRLVYHLFVVQLLQPETMKHISLHYNISNRHNYIAIERKS